jgi:hypothetical protein
MIERRLAALDIPVRLRTLIAMGFAVVVGLVCPVSFGALVLIKVMNPEADVGVFLNIFLTSLGYIVGILTGLLGLKE